MTDQDYDFICKLLRERSAVALESGKQYLVETRLAPVLRTLNLRSITDLVGQLRSGEHNGLHQRIVEALVTTETSFFRDHQPFEALRTSVIPDLIARRRDERRLNIWCAACSTGQEPYSLVLLLREHFAQLATWKIDVLATDISSDVLERARQGVYNQVEINRGLSAALLVKHFRQEGNRWRLNDDVRAEVRFMLLNLANAWPPLPRMDLVLLRNVLIYFDVPTKKQILARLARQLRPDGYLLLGGAETTFNLNDSFRRLEHLKTAWFQLVS
jgi:chemotaxis protein methyltransferase CheR